MSHAMKNIRCIALKGYENGPWYSIRRAQMIARLFYWVDAKVSADFFSFLCFKFLLKQNTINQQRIYHCYLSHTPIY